MLRILLLAAIGAYTLALVALEAFSGAAAVRPYLIDEVAPPFAHIQSTLSLSLLIATAILLAVTGRVERLSGRQTGRDRRIGAVLIALLIAVAIEDRFRLLPAWSGGSAAIERAAWVVLALVGTASLVGLARSRLGRPVPSGFWIAGAAGFAATFLADAIGGTWLVVEDLPRIWGAAFLLLAAARMLEQSITEIALTGPAGSAWDLGVGLAGRGRPVPRLTELSAPAGPAGPARRRGPGPATAPAPLEKWGTRPEDGCPEPDRSPVRASAAPPRKLLSH